MFKHLQTTRPDDIKPEIQPGEDDEVRDEDARIAPRMAVDLEIRNRPEKWRGEKRLRMGWDVDQDMERPAEHLVHRSPEKEPDQPENDSKDDEAMRPVIERMDERRDMRRIRMLAR